MTVLSKHALGQMRHIDLLALAVESGAAPSESLLLRLGSRSSEQLIDALTQPGARRRLAERAETRLTP